MKKAKSILFVIAVVVLFLTNVYSHDSWLIPEDFTIKQGEFVYIYANTGMDFPKSLNSIHPDRIERFIISGNSGKIKLRNFKIEGNSTIASCIPGETGTYTAALSLLPKQIKLTAKEFNDYLLADGLKRIYELRKKEGILDHSAIEFYSKYPKTIFQVGENKNDSCLKPMNLDIEIVPSVNPYTLKSGDKLEVKVLFKMKPLSDAELSWSYPGQVEGFAGTILTDKDGKAIVPLEKSGSYVLRLTHMEWVKMKTHEWESYWASLTFFVQD